MPRVITDGTLVESAYEPPPVPQRETSSSGNEAFAQALSQAILASFRNAVASMPPPVINVPKPEVKINAPVYVQPPDIKIPATTVNVPEGKAPVVNIEPANVTLKTERPNKWKFTFERNELGQITVAYAEAK